MPSKKRKFRKRRSQEASLIFSNRKISLLYRFVECTNCRNKSLEGLKGLVIDETKNTLKILCIDGKIRTVIKNVCWYYVKINNKVYLIPPSRVK